MLLLLALVLLLQMILALRIGGIPGRRKGILDQSAHADADLVLLGSSRCWMQLDPHFFDSAFDHTTVNLGVNGHLEISMAIIRLKHYLQSNRRPRFAILTFDPFSTPGSDTGNHYLFLKNDFARYSFLPARKDLLFLDYFQFNSFEKWVPLYSVFKYRLADSFFSSAGIRDHMDYGYENFKEKWDTALIPVLHQKAVLDEPVREALSHSLSELNQLCTQNKIRLLCLQTPVYKSLYDSLTFSATKKICHSLQIPFTDVDVASIRDQRDNFYNSNHLNKLGVSKMNAFLAKDSVLLSFLR